MNPKTRTVIEFMNDNLQRKLLLAELANSAKISVTHLGHLFRTDLGMSPGKYLIKLRMEKAREILAADSVIQVKEVMFSVGLKDKSNFVRRFRKVNGLSPSEYRAKKTNPPLARNDRKVD